MDCATREQLKITLRPDEGLVLRAYDDSNGHVIAPGSYIHVGTREPIGFVSIGYGRNLFSRGMTTVEAENFLSADITDDAIVLDKLIPWWVTLDPARQVVLANMAYQMGPERLVNEWPNFIGFVKAGQYGSASIEMQRSQWYTRFPKRASNLMTIMASGKL